MQQALKTEIKRLSRRVFTRSSKTQEREAEYRQKFEKRTGLTAQSPSSSHTKKEYPSKHFDPAYCARNANFLSKSIWHKILGMEYKPQPALNFLKAKPTGGSRSIMAFSIPDAAVANVLLERARNRNLKRLSAFSYAYHPQRNVFDAILALANFITDEKVFAVQIDFEKYFDSIPSAYLNKCIDNNKLLSLTPHERYVFKEFLYHRYALIDDYSSGVFRRRVKGTPQGCSISLLLSNVACHSLDLSLERSPGKFVRYADDVVALCSSYEEAQKIESCFVDHCRISGIKINESKSPGISIIANNDCEIRRSESFEYLGYSFSKDGLSISKRVYKKIRTKISRLIQIYLIQQPLTNGFSKSRCGLTPDFDWDLLGLISELRRYLYGGLDEADVQNFIQHGNRLPQMRGLMGFYALLDQRDPFRELDGWLANSIKRAMRKRSKILYRKYGVVGLTPNEETLILGTWLDCSAWRGANCPEATLPSFVRGWRAARKHYFTFGLENVQSPNYMSYY